MNIIYLDLYLRKCNIRGERPTFKGLNKFYKEVKRLC